MNKVIGVTDLQRNFRAVFDEVVRQKTPYVLTRDSRPEAVMVPYDAWLREQSRSADEAWARLDATLARTAKRNRTASDNQLEADIETAVKAVRAHKRKSAARASHRTTR